MAGASLGAKTVNEAVLTVFEDLFKSVPLRG